jgi:uncharacterized protein (TIGR02996 family)
MSATLRYDIGAEAGAELYAFDMDLFDKLSWGPTDRYAGIHKQRWRCYTFAVKLPKQSAEAVDVLRLLDDRMWSGQVRKSCWALFNKLATSLGLPAFWRPDIQDIDAPRQWPFLVAIGESPGDLVNWSAYSDWLQEQSDEELQRRGELIAGWLGPKAIKVKYGVPLLAQRVKGWPR